MTITQAEAKILYTLLNSLNEEKLKVEYVHDIHNLKVKLESIIFKRQYTTVDVARELKTSETSILEVKKRLGLYGRLSKQDYYRVKSVIQAIRKKYKVVGLVNINRYFSEGGHKHD